MLKFAFYWIKCLQINVYYHLSVAFYVTLGGLRTFIYKFISINGLLNKSWFLKFPQYKNSESRKIIYVIKIAFNPHESLIIQTSFVVMEILESKTKMSHWDILPWIDKKTSLALRESLLCFLTNFTEILLNVHCLHLSISYT